ncbi:GIY-YIG nuclease family protein [bacterium]|nr:GIY-YIG nuclease family protein [Rubripirellula sp.]MDA7492634.1 GIY-YIG nuclease family protein [bacterium]MDB4654267.1 GIY-YIG nuclease family protein [Rubripirellula sp.]
MSENQRPYSIRVFVPDGDPDGLRLVERSNWTGVGVVFKRTGYKQAASRPEFDRTGIYVLVGSSEDSTLPMIYIGEGDPVKNRLNQHYSKKDFWDWAVFFVTKDSSLNKAHVKHLESRLLELAKAAKQSKLDNTGSSLPPTLSEVETADVESFLHDMLSIFPLLGLSVFEKTESKTKLEQELLQIKVKGLSARGYEEAKGFVVTRGSQMVEHAVPSLDKYCVAARNDLINQGVVIREGKHFVFTQDQVFSSPSKAGAVVAGRSTNGREEWKTQDGASLKDLQEASLSDEDEDV